MKKSKITLLFASFASLAMSVGGAFALSYQAANKSIVGNVDEAIYLYWSTGEAQLQIQDVTDLKANIGQYRYFACQPSVSSNVTGTVTITYTIAGQNDGEKDYSLDGLKVNVYKTPSLQNDSNRDLSELDPVAVLDYDVVAKRTVQTSFAVGGENPGNAFYCLEFIYDGSQSSGDAWGGLMTISQAYAA